MIIYDNYMQLLIKVIKLNITTYFAPVNKPITIILKLKTVALIKNNSFIYFFITAKIEATFFDVALNNYFHICSLNA